MTYSLSSFFKAGSALCVAGVIGLATPASVQAQEALIGEVRAFGENFCPRNWTEADGKLLPIAQNTAMFSILGTMYGGDGRTTFGVPNLTGRMPLHPGTGPGLSPVLQGQMRGASTVTLNSSNLPSHSHVVNATNAQGNKKGPGTDLLADANTNDPNTDVRLYRDGSATPNRTMDPGMISNAGASQPLSIQSPYLAMTWCVATIGIFPSRN